MEQEKKLAIKQSNRVTNSLRDFTLYQEKVFMLVMSALQEAVDRSFHGQEYRQLALFQDKEVVTLDIPLRKIASPSAYKHLKDAILQMADKSVSFRYYEDGRARIYKSSLFSVDMPENSEWNGKVRLKMFNKVVEYLITISKDGQGRPIQYTKYLLDTGLKLKFKYSPKFYILLCSWVTKGSFYQSKEELYHYFLQSDDTEYKDFRKNILLKLHKELKEKADVFFEFEQVKEGRSVIGVKFKVISKDIDEKERATKIEGIKNMLKIHFGLKAEDLEEIGIIFEPDRFNYFQIAEKLNYLATYVGDPDRKIGNTRKYIKEALLRDFGQ